MPFGKPSRRVTGKPPPKAASKALPAKSEGPVQQTLSCCVAKQFEVKNAPEAQGPDAGGAAASGWRSVLVAPGVGAAQPEVAPQEAPPTMAPVTQEEAQPEALGPNK